MQRRQLLCSLATVSIVNLYVALLCQKDVWAVVSFNEIGSPTGHSEELSVIAEESTEAEHTPSSMDVLATSVPVAIPRMRANAGVTDLALDDAPRERGMSDEPSEVFVGE